MRALFVLGLTLAAAGCRNLPSDPGPLAWLLAVDPDTVSLASLRQHADSLETNLQAYHQRDGVIWRALWREPALGHPSHRGNGGDAALFTGLYLAAACYRDAVLQSPDSRERILDTLRGLHILTHISGTPGVLARCAFRVDQGAHHSYPELWQQRNPYVYQSDGAQPDVLAPEQSYPAMVFYTRATRDQLTGVLFGLAVAWQHLAGDTRPGGDQARAVVATIARALHTRIEACDHKLRDHQERSGTRADSVDGLQWAQLLALRLAVAADEPAEVRAAVQAQYEAAFADAFVFGSAGDLSAWFYPWANLLNYFAWNLRFLRASSLILLDGDPERREQVGRFLGETLFPRVRSHRNAHFILLTQLGLRAAGLPDLPEVEQQAALRSLRELRLRPLRSWPSPLHGQGRRPPLLSMMAGDAAKYVLPVHLRKPSSHFIWQKDPFDPGSGSVDLRGEVEATGVDFLLPYWLGRALGLWTDG